MITPGVAARNRWQMILTLSKMREVVLQVLTDRLYCLPMHWLGRSVMCAGEECPACGIRLPRLMYYFGAQVASQVRVVEVPSSCAQVIADAAEQSAAASARGLVVSMVRAGARDCWRLKSWRVAQLQADAMYDRHVCQQLAVAFRCGGPSEGEDFKAWHGRVRASQVKVLRGAHLFT